LEIFLPQTKKDIKIDYKKDLGATLAVDFHGQGPLLYLKHIHDEIESRTQKYGITFVTFTNSNGLHTLHTWVQGLAKRGIVSIVSANGGPEAVVPHNGTRGVFGTNPMAFGFPGSKQGEIHCVDMATSEAPFFEIMDAHKAGENLREGIAVDSSGNPTIKTTEALDTTTSEDDPVANLLPMGGGYKGYYLVYLLELMTSGLIGSPSSPEMSEDFIPEEHGAILIAFNPKALGTDKSLTRAMNSIHQVLRDQQPKEGEKITIPGENNNQKFVANADMDIEVSEDALDKLKALII
jgi:LDH2 family malate/lactate/ureidoglycolate dehydrogenase